MHTRYLEHITAVRIYVHTNTQTRKHANTQTRKHANSNRSDKNGWFTGVSIYICYIFTSMCIYMSYIASAAKWITILKSLMFMCMQLCLAPQRSHVSMSIDTLT